LELQFVTYFRQKIVCLKVNGPRFGSQQGQGYSTVGYTAIEYLCFPLQKKSGLNVKLGSRKWPCPF